MKVIAVNGSPRKKWNTHILLEKALEGAKEMGAQTELINLYDINFKGCTSCFACKLKGVTISKCAMKDELEPILQKICECDALLLGSPVYFNCVTGENEVIFGTPIFSLFFIRIKTIHLRKKYKNSIYLHNECTVFCPTLNRLQQTVSLF
ncbi:MAG: flavodoxin family protein [Treponema sp.]|nr:flavodoxin family protein [Treponema sp.]